ncbi:ribulokinase [candidate division KSB1 bacterium]|nr:ribulokinase [candidate division KSB1 bacterium]
MAIVAGVDFGTQSVRVSIVDSKKGRLGSAVAEYDVIRTASDPDHATQRPGDQMAALVTAVKSAIQHSRTVGTQIEALAIDTTGSTVIPVDKNLEPLDDYYLWCDHRAKKEAAEITQKAHATHLENIKWCGGTYSSEWGFSKVLHWLRNAPAKRKQMVTALEHCDMVNAVLCGIKDPTKIVRSVCAAGHKWMWVEKLNGFPLEDFWLKVDPLFSGITAKLASPVAASFTIAGHLSDDWARKLNLKPGIPLPVGAFDAHWDAIGAGVKEGDVVNVVGTSTCIMAIAKKVDLIPGVCGVVKGSVHPDYFGIEAGLSATGDIFEAIARRAGTDVATLSKGLRHYRAGQTGLLRMSWDNGDRTVLVNPYLGGVTLGWTLTSTAQDELFAAIEGTAFHTRIIIERMAEYGVPVNRIINAGGIPQKNDVLNQIYADVLGKPILIPEQETTSLGSAIFGFMAAGAFDTIEQAQNALCPSFRVVEPNPDAQNVYKKLFALYRKLYFSLGVPGSKEVALGDVLPVLREIASQQKK